jgi:ribonuclease-3
VEERSSSYERLAFLGDSVLSLSVSQSLFPRFGSYTAGRLTKIRAQVVSRRSCVALAQALDVPDRMREIVPDEHAQGLNPLIRAESVLAEAVEAGIGACFLHHGFERTSKAVADSLSPQIEFAIAHLFDYKSELQERLAQRGDVVSYTVIGEQGPPHERRFETAAEVGGLRIGHGVGRSKKESEQEAARKALESLDASMQDLERETSNG